MLKGLWSLTWLEIKIFVREPLGLIGTVAIPVVLISWCSGGSLGRGTRHGRGTPGAAGGAATCRSSCRC